MESLHSFLQLSRTIKSRSWYWRREVEDDQHDVVPSLLGVCWPHCPLLVWKLQEADDATAEAPLSGWRRRISLTVLSTGWKDGARGARCIMGRPPQVPVQAHSSQPASALIRSFMMKVECFKSAHQCRETMKRLHLLIQCLLDCICIRIHFSLLTFQPSLYTVLKLRSNTTCFLM